MLLGYVTEQLTFFVQQTKYKKIWVLHVGDVLQCEDVVMPTNQ